MGYKEKILTKLVLANTRLVVGTYTALTLPFYTVFQRPWRAIQAHNKRWVKVERSPDGSYYYYRRDAATMTLPNNYHLCKTFQAIYQKMESVEEPDKPKLAYRKVLSDEIKYDADGNPIKQDGRILKVIRLADSYTWLTTKQVFEKIDHLRRGFAALGPHENVLIYADTRLEWTLSAISLLLNGTPIVTLFSNLGQKGFIFGVNQTETKTIVTTFDLLDRIVAVIDQIPNVERIIYMHYDFQKNQSIPKFPDRVKLIPFKELEEIGKKSLPSAPIDAKPDEVAMIMYTSGTTGIPKAVIFTNKQLRSAAMTLASNVADIAHEAPKHSYASFLPLAHSMGFTFELFFFMAGVRVGYAMPNTLTDTSPANPPGQAGDLKLLKPTTIVSVPLIIDRIAKEIYLKLSARSPILPPLFTYLMEYKTRWTKRGYQTPILDRIVCKRVQEPFGGRLQYMVCGGAALNSKTEDLIRAALNVRLMIGYGLTETTGGVLGMSRHDLSTGISGIPLEGCSIRLIDWEEGGYTIHDQPNPRGEILISGDSVCEGYYKNEEENKAAFSYDNNGIRWFHSGDIAEILPSGNVKIIDRRKDLAKLPNGEYISLGKIETTIKSASLVENCCICISDTENEIVALVTPNSRQLKILAEKLKKSHLSHDELCSDPEVRQAFLDQIVDLCQKSGLHKREIPVKVHICSEEWNPDNDLLTSAFKLKRNNVLKHYRLDIQNLFDEIKKLKQN